jgi:predicted  nucleic acid-binding Zn-ribbon protein
MNREQFAELLTVQSLQMQVQKHLGNLKEQQDRLNAIKKLISERKDDHITRTSELQKFGQERATAEKRMAEQEKRLDQVKNRLSGSPHFSEVEKLGQEKALLEIEVGALEVQILNILDKESELTDQLQEDAVFFNGSQKTLTELASEIDTITSKEQAEMKLLQTRVEYHLSLVPASAKSAFLETCKKYLYNKPITYLEGNHCSVCRFRQDQAAISNIITFQSIEFCGGCGRILTSID